MDKRNVVKVVSSAVGAVAVLSLVSTHPVVVAFIGVSVVAWFYADRKL